MLFNLYSLRNILIMVQEDESDHLCVSPKNRTGKSKFIAEQLGCFPSDISHYIGGNRMPNREILKRLSQILRCRMKDLYPSIKYQVTYKS